MISSGVNHVTSAYAKASQKLSSCFAALALRYIAATQPLGTDQASFALGIVDTLLHHSDIFDYANQRCKSDLIDAIEVHKDKYIKLLQHDELSNNLFQTKVHELLGRLSNSKIDDIIGLAEDERHAIQEALSDMIKKCRIMFAEPAHVSEIIEQMQVFAISFGVSGFTPAAQRKLLSKLLLVKEVLVLNCTDHGEAKQNSDVSTLFYSNLPHFLDQIESTDLDDIFYNIVNFFIQDHNILPRISNVRLMYLYDRLKNLDIANATIKNLLQHIHQEAPFRYNYSRTDNTGYELLKRFQSYDTMVHQIENTEFDIAEAFLLHNKDFLHEVLVVIAKHINHIKALGSTKLQIIHSVLNKLQADIRHHLLEAHYLNVLNNIKERLETAVDAQIMNKYLELSQFAIAALKEKYTNLFTHIKVLLGDEDTADKSFLSQIIIKKFAQDYYITNASNSIAGLRAVAKDRIEIVQQLTGIDFADLLGLDHMNKITNLNLKKKLMSMNIKTPSEYVEELLKLIIPQCSTPQLDSLYRPLLQINLTPTQQVLKRELSKQIKQRTGIAKMLYSIITGTKQEYDQLETIKNVINTTTEELETADEGK